MIGCHNKIELGSFLSSGGRDFPELTHSQYAFCEIKESARKRLVGGS